MKTFFNIFFLILAIFFNTTALDLYRVLHTIYDYRLPLASLCFVYLWNKKEREIQEKDLIIERLTALSDAVKKIIQSKQQNSTDSKPLLSLKHKDCNDN